MNKKNKIKAIIAIAVAMAFVMPVAAVTNVGTIGVTSNSENTGDMENIVEISTNSDTSDDELIEDPFIEPTIEDPVIDTNELSIVIDDTSAVLTTGNTIEVDDDNPDPNWYDATHVRTITEGITNASEYDTVYVYNGTYYEALTINKQLDLIGESRENVIIDASRTGTVIYVTVDDVSIDTFTIMNGSSMGIFLSTSSNNIINCNVYNNPKYGIYLSAASNTNFINCNVSNNGRGFYLWGSSNCNIIDCNIYSNSGDGIYFYDSSNNITDCNVYDNNGNGIMISGSPNIDNNITTCTAYNNSLAGICINTPSKCKLSGNTIYDDDFVVIGPDISYYYHDIDTSNAINGKSIQYLVEKSNLTFDENDNFGYLALISCTNITAKNADVTGVIMIDTINSTISNVDAHHNSGYNGIYLSGSSNNNIMNCDAYNNSQVGIYLANSNNNDITSCNIYNNYADGIHLYKSSDNNIITCNVYNNTPGGFIIYQSLKNNIINCNAYNNSQYGIQLYFYSKNNNITSCHAYNNTGYGIQLNYRCSDNNITSCHVYNNENIGIYISQSPYNELIDNIIYDNVYNFGIEGGTIDHFNQSIWPSNTVDGKCIYYLVDDENITLDETNNIGFLGLISCTNITVKNSDVTGIMMIDTTDSTISNVDSHNSANGIYLWMSSDNNIMDCDVYNNGYGIYLRDSSNNNDITNCNAYDNNEYGIYIHSSSPNNIISCNVYNNNKYGIYLYKCSNNNDITSCNVYNNFQYGIYLRQSSDNNITSCKVYNNTEYGIYILQSSNSELIGNTLYDNAYNFAVEGAKGDFYQNIDETNTINGKTIYYLIEKSNLTFDENDNVGYLGLISCTNITVKNLDVSGIMMIDTTHSTISNVDSHNSGIGIYLWTAPNTNITDCNVYNNKKYGIYLKGGSSNCNIINCNAYDNNEYGIYLHSSSDNDILNCNVYNNLLRGIYLTTYSGSNIVNCNVYGSGYGLYIHKSSGSNIVNCDIYSNTDYGIYFYQSSECNIVNCDIYSNTDYGIYLRSSSNNNLIIHNSFVDNIENAYERYCGNIWDNGYPSGGNYWDDHPNFVDDFSGPGQNISGSDGIVDTPYNITGGTSKDNYPFMASPDTYILDISVVGSGTTTPTPGVHSYLSGTVVRLEAFPDSGWKFAGWSGDITTTDNPTTITMDSNKAVTATFTFDVEPPVISDVVPTPSDPLDTIIGWENFSCIVTDNVLVSQVKLIVTYPGTPLGTTEYIMINIPETDTYYYNTTFTDAGYYDYYVWAIDTNSNPNQSTSETFALPANWDINNDNLCDISDMIKTTHHFAETGPKGWIREDYNNDGVCDISDMIKLTHHFGEKWP